MSNRQVDLFGDDTNPALLHADGDRASPLAVEVADFIMKRFRELNPDAAPDALACGGCVRLLLGNLHMEFLDRAEVTNGD